MTSVVKAFLPHILKNEIANFKIRRITDMTLICFVYVV
ncbi:hypothetical protein BOVA514_3459 [Bacteroides ovatus]|nr:hypothetical protein BOVA514_3459 [Bacteroides ovatus]